MALQAILEEARRRPFQEIADSPTVKYYTNWRPFQERLEAPDSSVYPEVPGWVEGLGGETIVLSSSVESSYPYVERLERGFNVAGDLGVEGKLELYNTARLTAAVAIKVPEGVDAGRIVVVSLGGDSFTGHHVRIAAEKGSKAEVVLIDYSPLPGSVKILTARIDASEGSSLRLYTIAVHGGGAAVYHRQVASAGDGSRVESLVASSSGESTRLQLDYHLEGFESTLDMRVSSISLPGRWGDVVLNARHAGRESRSLVGGRGAAYPGGLLSMRGLAMILPEAEWSGSRVEVHVAGLGEGARAYASPMLEIHTGNVREAFHSASVSSLDEETLFYLATRGLDEQDAKKLLVDGILAYSGVLDSLGLPLGILLQEGR